ncbi:hypothetical protein AQJ30_15795 [Streptomyces longwoodensis]|uniref:Uncharacterized protein n=2 Tax=Streptomyces longwoodensis TaxID=68231 RepID=A0A101QXA8_9ACTN|nr:hypothetical protein AQJ30_15795 [Streptomyces longwoodensis]
MLLGLFVFVVMNCAAGVMGHPPVVMPMVRRALARAARRHTSSPRLEPVRRVPSWAREGEQ